MWRAASLCCTVLSSSWADFPFHMSTDKNAVTVFVAPSVENSPKPFWVFNSGPTIKCSYLSQDAFLTLSSSMDSQLPKKATR